MHPDAIRAQAEAELAALRAWPQAQRCRSGHHVGGPSCHQHADPTTRGDHLPIDHHSGLRPLPLEVWAAQPPTTLSAVPFETWAASH